MHTLNRWLARVAIASLAIGCLATLAMMLHVTLDVIGRVSGLWRVQGALETVTFIYMVAVVFLPLALVQAERRQIVVDLFAQMLPRRLAAFLDGLMGLLGAAFMLAFAWYGAEEALQQTLIFETAPSTTSPVPIWPARWMVVLAGAPVALYLFLQAIRNLAFAFGKAVADHESVWITAGLRVPGMSGGRDAPTDTQQF